MIRKEHRAIDEEGRKHKGRKPTNTTMVGVVQLMEEDVRPPLNVCCHHMNECLLLRLLHPQSRQAGLSPREDMVRAEALH
jgi:hypothetical protein